MAQPAKNCPDCGRVEAVSAEEVAAGLCPKNWAFRDQMAADDCANHAAARRAIDSNGDTIVGDSWATVHVPADLPWLGCTARGDGDLYEATRMSENVWQGYVNGTIFGSWRTTEQGVKNALQAEYRRRLAARAVAEEFAEPLHNYEQPEIKFSGINPPDPFPEDRQLPETTLARGMKVLAEHGREWPGLSGAKLVGGMAYEAKPQRSPWPLLQLAQLTDGPPGEASRGKWFIVETYLSTNGPRTRLCDGRFNTRAEAQAELDEKEKQLGR